MGLIYARLICLSAQGSRTQGHEDSSGYTARDITIRHLTAEEIQQKVEKKIGKVSIQAIYDIVHTLTEKGILRQTQPAGHSMIYELSRNPNHHHLICRNCGQIEDVDCAVGHAPCLEPSDDHGFEIDEAEVYYWGLCPRCIPEN